jgi:hypothetical protein
MNIKTFKDLKDFVNSLNENQLAKPVIAHRTDEWSLRCSEASTLEEEYYIDDYGAMVPNSAFDDTDPTDSLDDWDKIEIGTPFLYFDAEEENFNSLVNEIK